MAAAGWWQLSGSSKNDLSLVLWSHYIPSVRVNMSILESEAPLILAWFHWLEIMSSLNWVLSGRIELGFDMLIIEFSLSGEGFLKVLRFRLCNFHAVYIHFDCLLYWVLPRLRVASLITNWNYLLFVEMAPSLWSRLALHLTLKVSFLKLIFYATFQLKMLIDG